MNLTLRQAQDIETIRYFIPDILSKIPITDYDIEVFLAFSERGIPFPTHQDSISVITKGYEALSEGKRWRGIHVHMYMEGVLDGSMPYAVILEDMPKSVMGFMKREMFQGEDKEIIQGTWKALEETKEMPISVRELALHRVLVGLREKSTANG